MICNLETKNINSLIKSEQIYVLFVMADVVQVH